ncbi:UNVERIFIED_CONTAM: hypothetical protein GTU68_025291 [Idotea baltica]|nr:hypothetical protein [Idotea baltica]
MTFLKPQILISVFIVLILDQVTKYSITQHLVRGEARVIIKDFFNLRLNYNPGVAFGLFSDLPDQIRDVLLISVAVLAIIFILTYFTKQYRHDSFGLVLIGMIVGGALGNLVDRVRYGEVVDFLDFYFKGMHWPAFNIADSAICIGVILLLFRSPKSY